MNYGDFQKGRTVHMKFTTVDATGAPTAIVGGEVAVYADDSTAEVTTAETLTVSFDARTGLNHVAIATTGLSRRTDYTAVVIAGTVDGVSVVGYKVGHFSIENRYAPGLIARGVAQSGTASTIVLEAATNYPNTLPRGSHVVLVGGTGAGQAREVTAWTQASDQAGVSPDWDTPPDNTSEYEWYYGPPSVSDPAFLPAVNAVAVQGRELDANVGENFDVFFQNGGAVNSALVSSVPGTYRKGVQINNFAVAMRLTDGNLATGKLVTGYISKDGGAFAALSGAITEIVGGVGAKGGYTVDVISAAEVTADEILLVFEGAGCTPTVWKLRAQP